MPEMNRLTALLAAERQAEALFALIEERGLIAAGRSEREIEKEIYTLAEQHFGVTKHWHKRIVRAGSNTLCIAADNPPVRLIEADDIVFIDLGPVFDDWEADVGRSYVLGANPDKQRLCADLPRLFDQVKAVFDNNPDITGAELYRAAETVAEAAGWRFGGAIAGHLVAEFPHARIPGDKELNRISPANPSRMRDPDGAGQTKHWILEIHLTDRDQTFGGFYERLLVPAEWTGAF